MKLLAVIAGALALTACATPMTTQIGDNKHRIEVRGDDYANAVKASDQAYLLSAEVTIDAGHRYFLVNSANDQPKLTQNKLPRKSNMSLSGIDVSTGAESYQFGRPEDTILNSRVFTVETPGLDAVITTYADLPSHDAVDAIEIVNRLGSELNPDRWTTESIAGLKREYLSLNP